MPDPNALCRISSTESLEEVDSLKGRMSKQASSSDSVEELESFGEYSRLPLSIGPGFVETPFDNSNKLAVRVKFNSQTVTQIFYWSLLQTNRQIYARNEKT